MTGKAILQYEIEEELGRGGMGVVYKARDTKLDRPVALKFLPQHLNPSEHDIARFTQEAKAAAALNHPNVCTIYDIKEHEKHHFIVMEFVDGVTLRNKIAGGPLPFEEALGYGLQIADALHEAHARGIVHRDIKADNIMVNAKGQVKVMDFGLAKLKGTLKLTRSSSTLGTLAYMAPEQIQGGEVDARSDIFSFGVVLYELLTAHTPFRGEHEAAMMYSILNETPEPIQKFLPEAPSELLHVIGRALEKDPEDRYQTVQEMAIDLRRMKKESSKVSRRSIPAMPAVGAPSPETSQDTRSSTTVTPPPGTSTDVHAQGERASSRKTTTVTISLPGVGKGTILTWLIPVVVIVAIVIGYFTLFTGGEAISGERIPVAVADFQNQTHEDDLDGLSGMLITSLEQSRRLSVMTRSRMFDVLKQMGKSGAGRIDESLGREICRRTNTGALVVASISRFDELYIIDMKVLDPEKNEYLLTLKEEGEGKSSIPGMIDRLSEKTRLGLKENASDVEANKTAVAVMTTPSMEAYQAYFRGEELINKLRFIDAADEFRRAVEIDSTFAMAYYRLAYALAWNNSPGSEEAIGRAMRFIDGVPEKENYLIRGEAAMIDKDVDLGLSIYKELQARFPEDKEANYLVGDYSFHALDLATAEQSLRKVLSLDPTFVRAYQHLSWTLMFAKRFPEMREVTRRNIANAPSAGAYIFLAESYLQQGMYDSALAVCREAAGQEEGRYAIPEFEADVYLYQHRFDRARSIFDSMSTSKGSFTPGIEGRIRTAVWTGKFREALRWQDRLLDSLAARKDTTGYTYRLETRAFMTVVLLGDTAGAGAFHDRAMRMEDFGDADFYIALWDYLRAVGRFDEADRIVRTELRIIAPYGETRNRAWREYRAGDYGSAIRSFREAGGYFHDDLYAEARCFAATGQPDSALEILARLDEFRGRTFWFGWTRASTDAKRHYLAGTVHEQLGDRAKAIESYMKFLDVWKDADPGIPELVDGKRRLAALRSTAQN